MSLLAIWLEGRKKPSLETVMPLPLEKTCAINFVMYVCVHINYSFSRENNVLTRSSLFTKEVQAKADLAACDFLIGCAKFAADSKYKTVFH